MDSSSGGGANGDADVVATGVVSRGEGGAGAGSDADMVVTAVTSKKTYVFSMDELITTQNVLQETAESLQGWEAVPDVRTPPRGNVTPLPLHDALTCKAGGVLGEEDVPVASVDGEVECPLHLAEVVPKKLLQHMGGHILEDEVRRSYEGRYCFSCLSMLGVLKHPPNLTPRLAAPKGLPDMPEAESNYIHFW